MPYPRNVLLARQRDGHLPSFPIWDDVATLDGNPWRGSVDVLCGGFPCQDISAAGKGAGITGERSGLWKEYARLIGEMRPRFVFAENSPLLRTRGLGVVLEDLAALGYNARWGVLGAGDVGAPHKRDRMWVLAYDAHSKSTGTREDIRGIRGLPERCGTRTEGVGQKAGVLAYAKELQCNGGDDYAREFTQPEAVSESGDDSGAEVLAYSMHEGLQGDQFTGGADAQGWQESDGSATECGGLWWHTDPAESPTEPAVGRVAHGVANRVDRLKAIGNGQVPQCAAVAFNILSEGLI
jgi:DNA (cytosine-5)-methyltransferase 1